VEIDTPENRKLYWDGRFNHGVRLWLYCNRGLDIFNQARYLIMAIVALYYMMKLNNLWLIPLMFAVCIPILCVAGWFQIHKLGKVMDWLSIRFSTHYGMYNINLQEEIRDHLKKLAEDRK